jgi:outer membrane protein OmpA-like peptidoglycan-associated protein
MTGSRVQRIDLDDVEAIEAGAPGNGLAKFAHEINENYVAHGATAVAGTSQFPAAHRAGVEAESDVAEDLVGPGRRVAERDAAVPGAVQTVRVQDFTTYFLVFTLTPTSTASGTNIAVSNARRASRTVVNTYTIDGFATGSDALPAGAATQAAAALADLTAHPQATAHVIGFTDNVGGAGVNDPLSRRRAERVAAAILAGGGVGRGSLFVTGRGATGFVAANTTEAGRGHNRRVEITVAEPGP